MALMALCLRHAEVDAQGTGTADEMALEDRRNIATEGMVVAAVEVFRPSAPPSSSSSSSSSSRPSSSGRSDADTDPDDASSGAALLSHDMPDVKIGWHAGCRPATCQYGYMHALLAKSEDIAS